MTIAFHGHIKRIENYNAPIGKLAVTIQLPMGEADGSEFTLFVPEDQGANWLPPRAVQFTIYSFMPTEAYTPPEESTP